MKKIYFPFSNEIIMAAGGIGHSAKNYRFVRFEHLVGLKKNVDRFFNLSNKRVDPNLASLGQRYCISIIEGKTPKGEILGERHFQRTATVEDIEADGHFVFCRWYFVGNLNLDEVKVGLAFSAFMVILSFVVWYFVGNLNQFSIFFFLVGFFFIVLSTMISMSIRNKKRRIINGGPINHGYMCTLIPKHKLILQFSWFGDEIRLSICQKIPADYYIRVCHRKYSSGDNGTQTTENMVFLISKNHNWNFPLHAWFDIESEKEAINRVSKENWRRHLDAAASCIMSTKPAHCEAKKGWWTLGDLNPGLLVANQTLFQLS